MKTSIGTLFSVHLINQVSEQFLYQFSSLGLVSRRLVTIQVVRPYPFAYLWIPRAYVKVESPQPNRRCLSSRPFIPRSSCDLPLILVDLTRVHVWAKKLETLDSLDN